MRTKCGPVFLLCFVRYVVCDTKNEVADDDQTKPEPDIDKDENSIRHVIEDGVKPALFGSHAYDPIKQEFELITNGTGTTAMCDGAEESRKQLLRKGGVSVPASRVRPTPAAADANMINPPAVSTVRAKTVPKVPNVSKVAKKAAEEMQAEPMVQEEQELAEIAETE